MDGISRGLSNYAFFEASILTQDDVFCAIKQKNLARLKELLETPVERTKEIWIEAIRNYASDEIAKALSDAKIPSDIDVVVKAIEWNVTDGFMEELLLTIPESIREEALAWLLVTQRSRSAQFLISKESNGNRKAFQQALFAKQTTAAKEALERMMAEGMHPSTTTLEIVLLLHPDKEIIKELIDQGVESTDALFQLAMQLEEDVSLMLMPHDPSQNSLMFAVLQNRKKTVEELIKKEVKPTKEIFSQALEHPECLRALLQQTQVKATSYHLLSAYRSYPESVDILLTHGIRLEELDIGPLIMDLKGHEILGTILQSHQKFTEYHLFLTITFCDFTLVQLLVEKGVSVKENALIGAKQKAYNDTQMQVLMNAIVDEPLKAFAQALFDKDVTAAKKALELMVKGKIKPSIKTFEMALYFDADKQIIKTLIDKGVLLDKEVGSTDDELFNLAVRLQTDKNMLLMLIPTLVISKILEIARRGNLDVKLNIGHTPEESDPPEQTLEYAANILNARMKVLLLLEDEKKPTKDKRLELEEILTESFAKEILTNNGVESRQKLLALAVRLEMDSQIIEMLEESEQTSSPVCEPMEI